MVVHTLTTESISRLERVYEFRGDGVPGFLASNPQLVPLLDDIGDIVPDYFGPQARLELEVLHDPENGQKAQLFAVIQTPLAGSKAMERLRAFDEEWWFDRVSAVAGMLTVTLDQRSGFLIGRSSCTSPTCC